MLNLTSLASDVLCFINILLIASLLIGTYTIIYTVLQTVLAFKGVKLIIFSYSCSLLLLVLNI